TSSPAARSRSRRPPADSAALQRAEVDDLEAAGVGGDVEVGLLVLGPKEDQEALGLAPLPRRALGLREGRAGPGASLGLAAIVGRRAAPPDRAGRRIPPGADVAEGQRDP